MHKVVHQALRDAERRGYIRRNPASLMDAPTVARKEIRVFEQEVHVGMHESHCTGSVLCATAGFCQNDEDMIFVPGRIAMRIVWGVPQMVYREHVCVGPCGS